MDSHYPGNPPFHLNPKPSFPYECDPGTIPRIQKLEMPGMGMVSCSRFAKWAWDRAGGGCQTLLLECWKGGFKEPANIGAHETHVQVQSTLLFFFSSAARTIPCPFCRARTGTHIGHLNLNPWYGITYQDARYGIRNHMALLVVFQGVGI